MLRETEIREVQQRIDDLASLRGSMVRNHEEALAKIDHEWETCTQRILRLLDAQRAEGRENKVWA